MFFPPEIATQIENDFAPFIDKIVDDSKDNMLLRHIIKGGSRLIQKFSGSQFEYKAILSAACEYYQKNTDGLPDGLMAYLKAVIKQDPDVFKTELKFPTRKAGVWKKGSDILDDTVNAEDNALLPEELWNVFHENRITFSGGAFDSTSSSGFLPPLQILTKFFKAPFCLQEARRIAIFCVLAAGIHNPDMLYCADSWAKKGQRNTMFDDPEFATRIRDAISTEKGAWGHTIYFYTKISTGKPHNLAGGIFKGSQDKPTFFHQSCKKDPRKGIIAYPIQLAVNDQGSCLASSHDEFCVLLRNSMEHMAYLRGIDPAAINKIWNESSPSQFPLSETNRILKHDLRTICDTLKIKDGTIKKLASQILSEIQMGNSRSTERLNGELLDAAIDCPEILGSVKGFIKNHGYRRDGTLLELIQNADDALLQHENPQSLEVKIIYNYDILELRHYGRVINSGDREEYRHDLYNMLRFNGSEKAGTQATGKLGLGFKSVYLLSIEPWIQSGSLSFYIRNGIFPIDAGKRLADDDIEITIFHLPLENDVKEEEIFARLDPASFLIPAFSRKIEKLEITKKGKKLIYKFNKLLKNDDADFINDQENGIILFYCDNVKASLAIKTSQNNLPQRMDDDTPTLWTTLPLKEEQDWKLGYAINASFALDAGRLHLADDEENYKILRALGESLGRSLRVWGEQIKQSQPATYKEYFNAAWNVLSNGLESSADMPEKKKKVLQALHTANCGLAFWVTSGGALGHGIPEKWSMPSSKNDLDILIYNECGNPKFLEFVANLKTIAMHDKFGACAIVSPRNGQILRKLGVKVNDANDEEIFCRIFAILTDNLQLDPKLFKACIPLLELLPKNHHLPLTVKDSTGQWRPIKNILLGANLQEEDGFSDWKEDFTLAAFAPDDCLLNSSYVIKPEEAKLFVRLRSFRETSYEDIAKWISIAKGKKREKALKYLENLVANNKIWAILKEKYQDNWINDRGTIENICQNNEIVPNMVRYMLFMTADDFDNPHYPKDELLQKEKRPDNISDLQRQFNLLAERWKDNKKSIKSQYIYQTYPPCFRNQKELKKRLEDNDSEAWQLLLFMACLRSIGRTRAEASRNFIHGFHEDNKIIFTNPLDQHDASWLDIICNWEDPQIDAAPYSIFMEKMLYLHQISRFLPKYIDIIKKVPSQGEQAMAVFAPRKFAGFTGGGNNYDVPPLPLKIGRYWILRELARLNVDGFRPKNDGFLQYCWVPSQACLQALELNNMDTASIDDKHARLIEALREVSPEEFPTFDYWFDIAVRG